MFFNKGLPGLDLYKKEKEYKSTMCEMCTSNRCQQYFDSGHPYVQVNYSLYPLRYSVERDVSIFCVFNVCIPEYKKKIKELP